MVTVATMTEGLRRKPTYEEVIDYIEYDPDKIKYPKRTSKSLRNTFLLSQLDGMGQALLEQQQQDEDIKERVKVYQLHQLAIQNGTDVRTESAIQQGSEQSQITEGASGNGGGSVVRNFAGGVLRGAGSVARGVVSFLNPFGGDPSSPADSFQTPSEASPEPRRVGRRAAPVPSELDDEVADYENDALNERWEQESQRSQRAD